MDKSGESGIDPLEQGDPYLAGASDIVLGMLGHMGEWHPADSSLSPQGWFIRVFQEGMALPAYLLGERKDGHLEDAVSTDQAWTCVAKLGGVVVEVARAFRWLYVESAPDGEPVATDDDATYMVLGMLAEAHEEEPRQKPTLSAQDWSVTLLCVLAEVGDHLLSEETGEPFTRAAEATAALRDELQPESAGDLTIAGWLRVAGAALHAMADIAELAQIDLSDIPPAARDAPG
jgi:hypothetical protein